MQDREAFYKKLKSELEATTKFPANYLYKFIVPTDENQVQEVKNLFGKRGKIETRKSKTGKFESVSINLVVISSDEVINFYQKAEKIKGIISL